MAIHNDPLEKFSTLPLELFSIIAEYTGDSPAKLEKQLLPGDQILIQNDEFYKNRILTIADMRGVPEDLLLSGIEKGDKGNSPLALQVTALYEYYKNRISEIDPSNKYHLSLDNLPEILAYDKAFNKIQVWKKLPGGSEYLNSEQMRNLTLTEQASQLKTWIETNPAVVHDVNVLELPGLKLTAIPEEIGLLTNLTRLALDYNQIGKIENLGALNQLQMLDLSHNQISKMENMDTLTKLQVLNLSHNQISKMENMEALTQLLYIDLGHNQISKMENMEALTQLARLCLNHNQISTIENMDSLHKLKFLYLTKDHIYKNMFHLAKFRDLFIFFK